MTKTRSKPSEWLNADEIKRQVKIESVLDFYDALADLKGSGTQLTGKSPFREDDRHPSFSVNVGRGIWNDGAGRPVVDGKEVPGNVIGLVMAFEQCSFRDALVKLHENFIAPDPAAAVARETKGQVKQVLRNDEAAITENKPFDREIGGLRTSEIPYFEKKGITEETVKAFGTGYCSRGLMKSRIVFPIRSAVGKVMAYAGRAVQENQEPYPYKFPPGFRKQLELFNVERVAGDPATIEAVKNHGLVVVEGFTDVMKLAQEGFPNAVALMGSSMSDAQKAMLTDLELNPTRRLALFLDNDKAGREGRKKMAASLIQEAFIRYVDYSKVEKGDFVDEPSEPEHFTRGELQRLLRH